jgi:dephospho-CoA kinase
VSIHPTRHTAVRLGLTGGIGSGKSTVARMLQDRGATVVDADAIARSCTAPGGQAIPLITKTFGAEFVTTQGALDRERMRTLAFEQPAARQALQAILHPLIGDEIRRQSEAASARCIVFDIPLLVESPSWRPQLDCILVVDCLPATQKARVQARSGWTLAAIDAAMRSQASRQLRLAGADVTIFNDGFDLDQLRALVARAAPGFGL